MKNKKITVIVSVNYEKEIVDIPKNATKEDIEKIAKETMFNMIEWEFWETTKEDEDNKRLEK